MSTAEKRQRLNFLCAVASRALPDLTSAEKITLYEAMALVLPDKTKAKRAEYTAFALAKAEDAQLEMVGILNSL